MLTITDTTGPRRIPKVELRETIVSIASAAKDGSPLGTMTARGVWVHWSRDGGVTFQRGHPGSLFLNN